MRQLDRIGEALDAFHEARGLCEGFTPADDQYRYSACALHVSACNQIAHAHKLKSYRPIDPHELQQWYAPAIHSFEQVLVERPGWDSGWRLLSIAHASLGRCFQKAGRREQALTAFQTALGIRQQLLASGRASEGDRDRAEHHSCRIATLELDLAL